MEGFLKLRRVIVLATIVATLLASCAPVKLFSSPTPTPTASPTPTQTTTPSPTPTETLTPTPTPTQTLTPEQQRERDYGKFVPPDERCIDLNPDSHSYGTWFNFPGYVLSEDRFADLTLRVSDVETETRHIPVGPIEPDGSRDTKPVTALKVVCREASGDIVQFWLNLGGSDFGKNGAGFVFWAWENDKGTDIYTVRMWTPDELLKKLKPGIKIRASVLINPGDGKLSYRTFPTIYDPTNLGYYDNDVSRVAHDLFPQDKEQIDLLTTGQGVNDDTFLLTPILTEFAPFNQR